MPNSILVFEDIEMSKFDKVPVPVDLVLGRETDNKLKNEYVETSLVTQMIKSLPAVQETWVQSLGQEDPWRRKWLPIPVFLPGEFYGHKSLAGYSPWGHKELDMTE